MQSDPNRGDWLSNVWAYIASVENKVSGLEKRLRKLELDFQQSDAKPSRISFHPIDSGTLGLPLDED